MVNFDSDYAKSPKGVLRLVTAVFLFIVFILSFIVFSTDDLCTTLSRVISAFPAVLPFIIVSVVGIVVSLVLFSLYAFQLIDKFLSPRSAKIIVIVVDLILLIPIITLSGYYIAYEFRVDSFYTNPLIKPFYDLCYRTGSFGAAAGFGVLSATFLFMDAFLIDKINEIIAKSTRPAI